MSEELERFKEQVKKLKEEIEYLKRQHDWEHEVLMYIDEGEDFSYDNFLYYRSNAGWCNECDSVSVNEQHLQGGRTLENPNADGEYECYYCWEKNEDEKV
tara:strand:+ start:1596 stop:1895 length:300 start_codon:yes stop_codon:yes gene_type:complete